MANVSTSFNPQFYEENLGVVNFGPFARELVAWVPQGLRGAVLEIACGTGLVTRRLRERLDLSVRLVATDLSKPMLDYARAKSGGDAGIEWQLADACKLPFGASAFDCVVCGFGMMFPPDRQQAFQEVRRVMKDGALFVFTVWDRIEENPHALANAQAVEAMFPGDPEMKFRTPYELHDAVQLRQLLETAGLREVRRETRRMPIVQADPRSIAVGQIRGTPRSALIAQRGVDLQEAITRVERTLIETGGNPYNGHAQGILVEARVA
jgi:SAM-dependent methyltransferase